MSGPVLRRLTLFNLGFKFRIYLIKKCKRIDWYKLSIKHWLSQWTIRGVATLRKKEYGAHRFPDINIEENMWTYLDFQRYVSEVDEGIHFVSKSIHLTKKTTGILIDKRIVQRSLRWRGWGGVWDDPGEAGEYRPRSGRAGDRLRGHARAGGGQRNANSPILDQQFDT